MYKGTKQRSLLLSKSADLLAQHICKGYKRNKSTMKKIILGLMAATFIIKISTAQADILLPAKEIIENIAVPLAQYNNKNNYSYEDLVYLFCALEEKGINLNEDSMTVHAFQSGHGYWERDVIHEICIATFGEENQWSIEQRYWHGEMMVAIGAWDSNFYRLPEGDDLTEPEARKLAVNALKEAYDVDLPIETNEEWLVGAGFGSNYYDEGDDSYWIVEWNLSFSRPDKPNVLVYDVNFDRHGKNIQTYYHEELEMDEWALKRYTELMTNASKEKEATEKYGDIMYFWPDEIKVEIYGATGLPYAIPEQTEIDQAMEDAKRRVTEKYGLDALDNLGNYQVGYLFQKLDDEEDIETKATQLMWDIVLTTDPDFLSDGYRVQFQRIILNDTGEEEITDLIVDHANLWSLP